MNSEQAFDLATKLIADNKVNPEFRSWFSLIRYSLNVNDETDWNGEENVLYRRLKLKLRVPGFSFVIDKVQDEDGKEHWEVYLNTPYTDYHDNSRGTKSFADAIQSLWEGMQQTLVTVNEERVEAAKRLAIVMKKVDFYAGSATVQVTSV